MYVEHFWWKNNAVFVILIPFSSYWAKWAQSQSRWWNRAGASCPGGGCSHFCHCTSSCYHDN